MGSGRGDETKEASQMSLRAVKVETLAKVSPSTPLTKTLLDGKRQKRSRSGPKRPATLKVQMQKQLPVLPAKGGENLGRA
ncbi:uncharacterized protein J3R85_012685 [Psidium guajava]|nr:uncharacterized protein J3R85_012685 [Psidium guajava]